MKDKNWTKLFYNQFIMIDSLGNDILIHDDVTSKYQVIIKGSHVAIDKGVYFSSNGIIGNYVHISPYVTIIGGKKSNFEFRGFNNIMVGARIICGSDRFDSSGLFCCQETHRNSESSAY